MKKAVRDEASGCGAFDFKVLLSISSWSVRKIKEKRQQY